MNETGTAARAWINPTESAQRAETQIRRPSLRLIFGLEKTGFQIRLHAKRSHFTASEVPSLDFIKLPTATNSIFIAALLAR